MMPIRPLILLLALLAVACAQAVEQKPLPPFTSSNGADWFNSPPLQVEDLRGRVLLIDVWTYGCWNCYRSFPWLKSLEAKLRDQPFQVIGIHSPEFDHERDPVRVAAKIKKFGLEHPVMMDNDFAYWRALNNRYWPAFYLIDKQGDIRYLHVGETHDGDARAVQIETQIRALLDE
jgi:thiol-disulfide isomerase/thioredoxin